MTMEAFVLACEPALRRSPFAGVPAVASLQEALTPRRTAR